jgi:hypothetical protein
MAKSVSVAAGESETTHRGELVAPALAALTRGSATRPRDSARVSRRDLNMDISFSVEVVWATDGYPNNRSLPRELIFHISSQQATWLRDP